MNNTLTRQPNFTLHRDKSGAPVAVDAAGFDLGNVLRCKGWQSVLVFAKFTGGIAPTVDIEPGLRATYDDDGTETDTRTETPQGVVAGLTEEEAVVVNCFDGDLILRLDAVAGNPTRVRLFVSGYEPSPL